MDVTTERVLSYAKRLMQTCAYHQPPFICGALFLLSCALAATPPALAATPPVPYTQVARALLPSTVRRRLRAPMAGFVRMAMESL